MTEQVSTTFYGEGEGWGKEKREPKEPVLGTHHMQATLEKLNFSSLLVGGGHCLYYYTAEKYDLGRVFKNCLRPLV